MALSNYPPGVTGNEFPISGPTREWLVEDFECPASDCDYVGPADAWYHPDEGEFIDCPQCGGSICQGDDLFEEDPDDARDRWLDQKWEQQHP
jgi:hypothetical protein